MSMFKEAVKEAAYIKMALMGVTGSGKTMSALRLAKGLVGEEPLVNGGKIAMLDTENRSGALYSGDFKFLHAEIRPPFSAADFVAGVNEAQKNGVECLIVDSASHIWEGVLEYKDNLDAGGRGNGFTNWNQAGRQWKQALNALLQCEMHVIACVRSKMEYAIEKDGKGKQTPKRIGLAPILRDGSEYEFTLILELNENNTAQSLKDRTKLFPKDRPITPHIDEDTGVKLRNWLTDKPVSHSPKPVEVPMPEHLKALEDMRVKLGASREAVCNRLGVAKWEDITAEVADEACTRMKAAIEAKNKQ